MNLPYNSQAKNVQFTAFKINDNMALIPNETIEEIKDRANIADIIGGYIQLKRSGTNFSAVCPFHKENTPSFMVSPQKQIFHCFGCHVGGNVFKFVMEYDKLSFVESVKKVATQTGYDISKIEMVASKSNDKRDLYYEVNNKAASVFEENLRRNSLAKNYFESRNVTTDLMQKFRLGYADDAWNLLTNSFDQNERKLAIDLGLTIQKERAYDRFRQRLIFPIFDVNHHIVGFGGRRINEEQNPKYLNSPDSSVYNKSYVLYGLSHALDRIRTEKNCIFVEGYMDVLRCHQYGIENVVATSGTALTASHARLIKRYCSKVFLIFDSDDAGLNAMVRSIPILLAQSIELSIVPMPKGHDPDSVLATFGKEKFDELLSMSVDYLDFQYRFYNKRGDFKQNTTKSAIIKQMIDHTNSIPDEFLKSLNKSRIAKLFDMDELTVNSYQVKKYDIQNETEEVNSLQSIFEELKQSKYFNEVELLSIIFRLESEKQHAIINELSSSFIKSNYLKALLRDIQNVIDDAGVLDINLLKEYDKSGFYTAFIDQAQLKEFQNLDEYVVDILFKLEIQDINQQIKKLKSSTEQADLVKIADLQKEKLRLKGKQKENASQT